ncbi:MAG: hypothetical protein AAB493_02450 [Patescibacteria group bacterium]
MMPLEDFKKMLPADRNFTEEEILKMREQITDLANFLVKMCVDKELPLRAKNKTL